jgi:uncharacterized protein
MIFTGNRPPLDPELQDLLKRAAAKFDAMTPEQRREMMAAQRRSWAPDEAGMGSDADEAAYAAALRAGDTETVARLEAESQARMRSIDETQGEGEV